MVNNLKAERTGDDRSFIPFLNQSGKSFGLISREFDHPSEVFVTLAKKYQPQKITSLQPSNIRKLGVSKAIEWRAKDKILIEGILVLPVNHKKDKPLPLIVACHGGPNGSWPEAFIGSAEEQAVLQGIHRRWFDECKPQLFSRWKMDCFCK